MFRKRLTLFFLFSLALHLSLLVFLVLWTRGWFSRQPLGGGVGGSMLLVNLGGGGQQGVGGAGKEEGEKKNGEEEKVIKPKKAATTEKTPVLKKEALIPEKKSERPMASIPSEPSKQEEGQKAGRGLPGVEKGTNEGGGTPGSGSGAPGEGGGEGGGKGGANILAEIRRKIERNKHYPQLASLRNIEGTVWLYFRIEENGGVSDLHMVKSSGSSILDEEALATVRRSVPLPYYSKPLRIPLEFSREED